MLSPSLLHLHLSQQLTNHSKDISIQHHTNHINLNIRYTSTQHYHLITSNHNRSKELKSQDLLSILHKPTSRSYDQPSNSTEQWV